MSNKIWELMQKEEPLTDELIPYVSSGGTLGEMIHHPLIIEMSYVPERCALINERLRLKKEEREKAMQEGRWNTYVFIHERPYRVPALLKAIQISGQPLYDLVANVWTDSENIWQYKKQWTQLWAKLPYPQQVMDPNEMTIYSWMPEIVTIHRGIRHRTHTPRGLSWTRDKERASWFAVRWRDKKLQPLVLSAEVEKRHVLAFFMGRGEEEVVVLPKHIRNLTKTEIDNK